MTTANKIKKDVEKILTTIDDLEKEYSNFHSIENKQDFEHHIQRAKVFLSGTEMIVARDKECKKMDAATRTIKYK